MKKTLVLIILMLITALTACTNAAITSTTTAIPTTTATTAVSTTALATSTTTTTLTTITTSTVTTTDTTNPDLIPVVSVNDATTIKMTSAVFSGSIIEGLAIDRQGFEWGTSTGSYGFSWVNEGEFKTGSYEHLVTGLTEGTTYYFRSKAHNKNGWGYSEEKSFRTLGLPKITGISVNSVLQGEVLDLVITGLDLTDTTAVNMGAGITINNFSVSSDTQIIANISVADDAAAGFRSLTVTTLLGTDTLEDCFTVWQVKAVLHSVIWTDSQFNEMIHDMTAGSGYVYELKFHDGSQVTFMADKNVPFWVEMRNGKLCFTNVQQSHWDDVFSSAGQYLSYDSATKVMTFNAIPEAYLQTLFDVPKTTLPEFKNIATGEGVITIYYYSLDIISQES